MGRITGLRAVLLLVIVATIMSLYGVKLYSMQVVDAEENGDNATTYTIYTRVRAARGEILDTNGNKLVTNRASYDLHLNHYVMLKAENTNGWLLKLAKLCKEMDVSYIDHFPVTAQEPFAYTLDEQSSTWKGYFQKFLVNRDNMDSDISAPLLIEQLRKSYKIPEDWTNEEARMVIGLRYELTLRNGVTNLPTYVFMEDVSEEVLTAVLALDVPGLMVEASSVREYSTQYAAHILGYIGAMSAAQWEQYKQIDGYEMDAYVGQSGLEKAFEEYLHGVDGIRKDKVTKDGVVIESTYVTQPQPGSNVEVSIDLALQEAAEDKLAEVLDARREAGVAAEGGAVVAIDVKTGQVLVCGSYPTYDLSTLFEDWNELQDAQYNPLLNRALQGTYAPGSTFKVAMLIAGANLGLVDINTQYYDAGYYSIPGYTPKCNKLSGHGWLNGVTAIQKSCNCYFYWLADQINEEFGWDAADSVIKALGLGEATGVELYEQIGARANPQSKAEAYSGYDANWLRADALMAGIGQSVNAYTPMQLAVYASTLANQGVRNKATFLSRVMSSDYSDLVCESEVEVLSKLTISEQAKAMYIEGMKKVAQESGGTAYSTFKNYPVSVAAKTGTAEGVGISNGAFICFAPADDPQIAIAVYGEHAKGGSYLAPVAKAILDVYFGLNTGDVDNFENQLG